jgi:hypothetical protein
MKAVLKQSIDPVQLLVWSHNLYVAYGELVLDSPAAAVEGDGVSGVFAGMQYYLSFQNIQSVSESLHMQINHPNPSRGN